MVIDESKVRNLRDLFCSAVTTVFGNSSSFLDFLEDYEYSNKYDCYLDCSGENYIINRETGEYVNWYKLTHIGRCICVSYSDIYEGDIETWLLNFLKEFKVKECGNETVN